MAGRETLYLCLESLSALQTRVSSLSCLRIRFYNSLKVDTLYGRRKIAEMLNREGYCFRRIDGKVALFVPDDVRRITASWIEYAGGMVHGKADRRRSKDLTPDNAPVDPERAVFDVDLCRLMGSIRQERTRDYKGTIDYSVHIDAKAYPLSKLIYCAHCERAAIESNNIRERSYLTGRTGSQVTARRYRHDTERTCSAETRSVKAELIEGDFVRLLKNIALSRTSGNAGIQRVERSMSRLRNTLAQLHLARPRFQNDFA
jgi:hypothetical protein